MKRWPSRQVLTLLLGVFLTLGMSLSAAQASDMAVKMAMASGMGASGHGGCDGCDGGGGDDGAASSVNCLSVCTAPASAVLPATVPVKAVQAADLSVRTYLISTGRAASPDPYPPRPVDLA